MSPSSNEPNAFIFLVLPKKGVLPFIRFNIFLALVASAGAAPAQSPQSEEDEIDPPMQRVLLSKFATKPFCGEASLVNEVAEDANMKNFPVLSISWSATRRVKRQSCNGCVTSTARTHGNGLSELLKPTLVERASKSKSRKVIKSTRSR